MGDEAEAAEAAYWDAMAENDFDHREPTIVPTNLYAGTDDGFRLPALPALPKTLPNVGALGIPIIADPAVPPGQAWIVQPRPTPRIDTLVDAVMSIFSNTNKQKGKPNMNTKSNIQAQIDRLQDRLARYARFPETEEFPVGTIIGFDVRFSTGPKVYHYAAVKSDKGWSLTGRNTGFWQWSELVAWLAEKVECLALVVCAEVEELIEPVEVDESAYAEGDSDD